jgi:hypothetical protein
MITTKDPTDLRSKRRYYLGMASVALLIVIWGFAPSYYLKSLFQTSSVASPNEVTRSASTVVRVHAAVFTVWIVLFVCQTFLVAIDQTNVHRRLGVGAAVLALLMVVLGVSTAIQGGRDNWNPGGPFPDSLSFMAVSLFDILIFSVFVGCGLYYRKRTEMHKRLMLLGTIGGLTWPAITRMRYIAPNPPLMFGVLAILILALPAHDIWINRRVHPVSLWGSSLILASFPLRSAIALTSTWHDFAAWLVRF